MTEAIQKVVGKSLSQQISTSSCASLASAAAEDGDGGGNKPKAAGFIRRLCCGIRVNNCLLAYYFIFYGVYLALGALGFSYFEEPVERELKRQLDLDIKSFLGDHSDCLNESALDALLEKVIQAHNRGVSPHPNVTTEPNWSFGQAFFFSGTVVTTIGYGHVTPLSKEGKVFCILYAALGIPLTFTLFSAIVERLLIPVTYLQLWLGRRLPRCSVFSVRLLHAILLGILVLVFVLLLPAVAFYALEPDWDFLDSVYYCFISLTTIGLGDFVPGDAPNQKYRPLYKILAMVYLLVGLAFVMLFIEVFISIPGFNLAAFMSPSFDEQDGKDDDGNGNARKNKRPTFAQKIPGRCRPSTSTAAMPTFAIDNDYERLPINYNRAYARRYTEETEVAFPVESEGEDGIKPCNE